MFLCYAPTLSQLQDLFRRADDDADHHRLWVDVQGCVHLDPAGDVDIDEMMVSLQIFYGTFSRGGRHVGPLAADDFAYMTDIFDKLLGAWTARVPGTITFIEAEGAPVPANMLH